MIAEAAALLTRPRFEFREGRFDDLPSAQYHECEAMSSGGAKKILRSPAHFRLMRDTPNEPTAAMQFGTAVHSGVLEPDTFDAVVCAAPNVDKRTRDGKAEYAYFEECSRGKIILSAADMARAIRCIEAVRAHPAASRLLDGSEREVSLFWNDARYRVPCKCRFDALNHGGGIDLKTTKDASPAEFARSVAGFQYHLQAALYCAGYEAVIGEPPKFFAFIAVESEPPHAVACYVLPANAMLAGARLLSEALGRYAVALDSGEWRSYPETIDVLELPKWATRFD